MHEKFVCLSNFCANKEHEKVQFPSQIELEMLLDLSPLIRRELWDLIHLMELLFVFPKTKGYHITVLKYIISLFKQSIKYKWYGAKYHGLSHGIMIST